MEKSQSGRNRKSCLLFLSHAGVDTDAARALAERIESTPEARQQGLKIWFDKKDLKAGEGWQAQLEQALEHDSTAFAVYVGSRGVINWVDSEVRVALSRARSDPNYPFIPILSQQCSGSEALPAFARQYQGVIDVEHKPDEFAKLIRAATREDRRVHVQLVDEPFIGLRAFEERDTHLFFGRDDDADELVKLLKRSRLVMVVGDSGSGKSSLVKAGLVPRYRGGAMAEQRDPRSDDIIWHVVETRPRSNPFDSLADSVATGARAMGRSQDDIRTLRKMVREQTPQEVADAMRDGAPERAKILVVVDQFEELFTLSDKIFREPYIDMLLYLAKDDSSAVFRLVLTMRRDYYNLCHEHSELYTWLEDKARDAKFSVRRMSDAQLRSCIEDPLALTDVGDTGAFVDRVLADVGDQPGELALLEMALTESWRRRDEFGGDMLQAYVTVGGTAGALANVAEEVFGKLNDVEQALAEASLIRLVRLGETGGTTRRVARRDEFSEDAWRVLQKLAREDYGRLIHIRGGSPAKRGSGDLEKEVSSKVTGLQGQSSNELQNLQTNETAELSHEALVSQWPRYQTWLQASPDLKRIHDNLITPAKRWAMATTQKSDELLTGNRLSDAVSLMHEHPLWLSGQERSFIKASQTRSKRRSFVEKGAVALLIVLTVAAVWFGYNANIERDRAQIAESDAVMARDRAETEKKRAQKAETIAEKRRKAAVSRRLLVQAESIINDSEASLDEAVLLSIEAIKHDPSIDAINTLQKGLVRLPALRYRLPYKHVSTVQFVNGGKFLATVTDGRSIIWSYKDQKEALQKYTGIDFGKFEYSAAGTLLAAVDDRKGDIRILDTIGGRILTEISLGEEIRTFALSPKGSFLACGHPDGNVTIWDTKSGLKLHKLPLNSSIKSLVFDPTEHLLSASLRNGVVKVWTTQTAERVAKFEYAAPDSASSANLGAVLAFNENGNLLAGGRPNGTISLWNLENPAEIVSVSQRGAIRTLKFHPDNKYLWTSSADKTVRAWEIPSGVEKKRFDHESEVYEILLSPDSKHLITASSNIAQVWNWSNGTKIISVRHDGFIRSMSVSSDGGMIATVDENGASVWRPNTGWLLAHEGRVWSIVFSADGKRIATSSDDRTAKIWDTQNYRVLADFSHVGRVGQLAFNRTGTQIVSASDDWTARIWDIDSKKLVTQIFHEGQVKTVAFSNDGHFVASSAEDNSVIIWDMRNGDETFHLILENPILKLSFMPDGRHFIVAQKQKIEVWNHTTQTKASEIKLEQIEIGSKVAFDSRGDLLAAEYKSGIFVYDIKNKKEIARHQGNYGVADISFSPDSKRFAVACYDGVTRVWNVGEEAEIMLINHKNTSSTISFSPGGNYVASGGWDKEVQIWDLETGKKIVELKHDSPLWNTSFSPDERYIVTTTEKKVARKWLWQPDDLTAEACSRLNSNFSRKQWANYFGDLEPYQKTCDNLPVGEEESEELQNFKGAVYWAQKNYDRGPSLSLAAKGRVDAGIRLAKEARFEESVVRLKDFIRLSKMADPNFDIGPMDDNHLTLYSIGLFTEELKKGMDPVDVLVKLGEIDSLQRPGFISSSAWNSVCWNGLLIGKAAAVMEACDKAVELCLTNCGQQNDSRGIARALTGDHSGAVEDLDKYIRWVKENNPKGHEHLMLKRERWIQALKAGVNPFDSETLKALNEE